MVYSHGNFVKQVRHVDFSEEETEVYTKKGPLWAHPISPIQQTGKMWKDHTYPPRASCPIH